MSADWKAGDRALCIADAWDTVNFINETPPRAGNVYLVIAVNCAKTIDGKPDVGLLLSGCAGFKRVKKFVFFSAAGQTCFWSSLQFRKIVPACDRESITNYNTQDA